MADQERTGRVDDDFVRFYELEFARAARLAHLLTGSDDHADDLAQDAMLRMRDRFGGIECPEAYLTTIVVNLCRNWARTQSRRSRRDRAESDELRRRTSVGGDHEHDHRHHDLLELVDELPFRQRTVLVARYWLGYSEAEIADLLRCRPGTVKSLASRALSSLRKDLA